jgi:hypothetical protein
MKTDMNFAFAILSFLSASFCSKDLFSDLISFKKLNDSVPVLINVNYTADFPTDLKKNTFFLQQITADFKQREKKQSKNFILYYKQDSAVHCDIILNFTFYNFRLGEEKTDQSMRLATMKKIQTVFDKEAEQHKRQDVDYSADVTHVKKSIDCSATIILTINSGNGQKLFNKIFNGKYNWENEYVTYTGDKEALTEHELQLSRNRNQATPSTSLLYREVLKITFTEITSTLDEFFGNKMGF